jgi:TRAP-type mannitol/chloroaromatic compound transport system substrate-binding protein
MVTDWPAGVPGLQDSAVRLGKSIEVSSGGRLRIEVFSAGALVRAAARAIADVCRHMTADKPILSRVTRGVTPNE